MSASVLLRYAARRSIGSLPAAVPSSARSPLQRASLERGGAFHLARFVHSTNIARGDMMMGSLLRKTAVDNTPSWWWGVSLLVAMPAMAVAQGSLYLAKYRMYYGDAPFPASPSQGLVMVQSNVDGDDGKDGNESQTWISKLLGAHKAPSSPTEEHGLVGGEAPSHARKGPTGAWLRRWVLFWRQSSEEDDGDDLPARERPLRLLVIGDSLAAGVGTSKLATPILPEAIARSLSRALEGRAVYWTSHGTPGASAVNLLDLITLVQESDRRDWGQVEQELAAMARPVPYRVLASLLLSGDEVRFAFYRGRDWFRQRRQRRLQRKEDTPKGVNRMEALRADASDFVTTVLRKRGPPPSLSQFDADGLPVDAKEGDLAQTPNTKNTLWSLFQTELTREIHRQRRQRARARNGAAPQETEQGDEEYNMGRYDVAVVMTGLNDLKQVVLPFMNTKTADRDENRDGLTFLENLRTATDSLLSSIMERSSLAPVAEASVSPPTTLALSSSSASKKSGPIVVLPALIIEALPMFQHPPFRWFGLPFVKAMDEKKRELAIRYPDSVLYVEAPTSEMLTDMEEGRGPLWAQRYTDRVVLDFHNITAQARDNMQRLMDEFYNRVTAGGASLPRPPPPPPQNSATTTMTTREETGLAARDTTWKNEAQEQDEGDWNDDDLTRRLDATMMMAGCDSVRQQNDAATAIPGSKLVAVDNIHPNDEGYEMWGRHIAMAIYNRGATYNLQSWRHVQ